MNISNRQSILFNAIALVVGFTAIIAIWQNTRSYDDRKEGVIVFFEKLECRQRNFPLLPLGADPIDVPVCGKVGNVTGRWN